MESPEKRIDFTKTGLLRLMLLYWSPEMDSYISKMENESGIFGFENHVMSYFMTRGDKFWHKVKLDQEKRHKALQCKKG